MAMTKKSWVKLAAVATLVVLFLIVVFQNMAELREGSDFHFFFWTVKKLPDIVFLIITFLMGALGGMLVAFYVNRRRQ